MALYNNEQEDDDKYEARDYLESLIEVLKDIEVDEDEEQ